MTDTLQKELDIIFSTILVETSPQALPLGAACVASSIKNANLKNVNVQLIDVSYDEAKDEKKEAHLALLDRIEKAYDSKKQLVAFFSVYVWNALDIIKTATLLKQKVSNAVFICGGPEITARFSNKYPEISNDDYKIFDFAITGEGETEALNLVRYFLTEKNFVASKKTPVVKNGIVEDCQKLPSPWIDGTLDPVIYNGVLWELSRGCPFNCSYCYESKGIKKVRHFDIKRLEKELDIFAQKKVPQVFVLDPTFNANKERALQILHLIEKKLSDAHFQFEIRAEFVDKQLAEAFSKLSCSLQIGLQSANPNVLQNINRTFNRKNFSKKVAILNEYGLIFGFDLIFGLPGDTLPSYKESIDYAISLYPNHLELFRLSVLPGTDLYDKAQNFGIKAESKPPYHVICTPKFSQSDLLIAENLSFACTVFYSEGRAVPWFLLVLAPLKIKPSQFFSDFAEWQRCNNCMRTKGFDPCAIHHKEIEKMQLSFLKFKYEEKGLQFAFAAVRDIVQLYGAISRVIGEGEETILNLSYHPDDVFNALSVNLLMFVDEVCMEHCKIRVFASENGPDYEIIF